MKLRLVAGLFIAFALAGCSAVPEPAPVVKPTVESEAVEFSAEDYTLAAENVLIECADALGVSEAPAYAPSALTPEFTGLVTVSRANGVLTWNVAPGPQGGIIIEPADPGTQVALESAGC